MRIPSGKTDQVIYYDAVDPLTGAAKTGLSSFTVYRSRNGGAATIYTTPTITELSAANMPGAYALLIDEDTTIAAGSDSEAMLLHITQASMAPVRVSIELYRRDTTSGKTALIDSNGRVDVAAVAGTAQTAKDLGASTTQTGDSYARLGAPAGVSHSADVAAVKTDTAAVKVQTDKLTFTVANQIDANVLDWKSATAPAMTGDAFARIGTAGAGLTALGDTRVANLDAAVSTRSTFAGGAVASVTADVGITQAAADKVWGTTSRTLSSYGTLVADIATAVWAATTRLLTAGTNIVLANGVGVTGLNDLDAAGVRSAVGLASANMDTQLAAISSKTGNLPSDPADQSLIIAATDAVMARIGVPAGVSIAADIAGVSASIPAVDNDAIADALLDRADAVETGLTPRKLLRLVGAVLGGKVSGAGSGTEVFRNAVADSKPRITATVDSVGDRTAITFDLT